jgi:hypothetical protein
MQAGDGALWETACLSPALETNKATSFLFLFSLRQQDSKHGDTQGQRRKSVLPAKLLAVGLRSLTVFDVSATGASPLISCPMFVGFAVGTGFVALPATPLSW